MILRLPSMFSKQNKTSRKGGFLLLDTSLKTYFLAVFLGAAFFAVADLQEADLQEADYEADLAQHLPLLPLICSMAIIQNYSS